MVNDFISKQDLPLLTNGARFSLAALFLQEQMERDAATFDLFVRELPQARNYLVFAGLEHVIDYLLNLRFSKKQLAWIKKSFGFSAAEMDYFRNFRFSGDLWAMPEGTIFFPGEPIIRVSAPLAEAQLIKMFLINKVYVQTILATKISRFVRAAKDKKTVIGWNRSYGLDAAIKSARINEIFGMKSSLSFYHYKNKSAAFSTSTYHYLMMAFSGELESFRVYLKNTQGAGYVLVDTYNSIQGIKNFIIAARELREQGVKEVGIQLDSGDRYALSVTARQMLDQAGLPDVKIFAMGNFDEYAVDKLERRGAPIDVYAGTTEILTPTDAPTIELVYKLSELRRRGKIMPKMKTSTQKISLPGRKQVFRISKNEKYHHDVIGLDAEKMAGAKKLLLPFIKGGRLVRKPASVKQIGAYYQQEIKKFNPRLFDINKKFNYSAAASSQLRQLTAKTKKEILRSR